MRRLPFLLGAVLLLGVALAHAAPLSVSGVKRLGGGSSAVEEAASFPADMIVDYCIGTLSGTTCTTSGDTLRAVRVRWTPQANSNYEILVSNSTLGVSGSTTITASGTAQRDDWVPFTTGVVLTSFSGTSTGYTITIKEQ